MSRHYDLNMMYPRLRLARNLLTDDGVIFISIDDNEQANLKKLCDEVFGEENFVAIFLWTKTNTPPSLSNKTRKTVEYVLCYEKQTNSYKYFGEFLENGDAPLLNTGNPVRTLEFPPNSIHFTYINEHFFTSEEKDKLEIVDSFQVENNLNNTKALLRGEFKWTQEMVNDELSKGTYFLIKSNKFSMRFQRVESNDFKTPNNFLELELNNKSNVKTNEMATKELESLRLNGCFDHPKPISLLNKLINAVTYKDINATILDFFSGSATTAHAAMQLNAEDGGNRKFIMVQLPEETDEKSEAYKAGYRNIAEIGKERIRRAGEKIKKELVEKHSQQSLDESTATPKSLDIGFKVLKLDTSNIKPWNPGAYEDIQTALADNISPYIPGRSEEDVVFELMLKMGLSLTYPIEEYKAGTSTIYSIGFGALMICLSDTITMETANKMNELYKKLAPETWRVVCRDEGFASDSAKTNVKETLKSAGLSDDAFITL